MDVDSRFQKAIQSYWETRAGNREKQKATGRIDAGSRGEVTGGTQMAALEILVSEIICDAGLRRVNIFMRSSLELPGYFRGTKKWDLVAVAEGRLVLAMEFKSQAGKSIGNNVNNRTEEAVGSANDIWTAYREGRFGQGPAPFLGYFFLLEDRDSVKRVVGNKEPHFPVDPVFRGEAKSLKDKNKEAYLGISYGKRYETLCQRLVLERLYNAACFTMATNEAETQVSHPSEELSFQRFAAAIRGHVIGFVGGR